MYYLAVREEDANVVRIRSWKDPAVPAPATRQSLAVDECISSTALEVWENVATDSFLYDKISRIIPHFAG